MQIERLLIENFKSIERIELKEPNPFTVFVGPNGSGKSNIFEALEFGNRITLSMPSEAARLFGGPDALIRRAEKTSTVLRIAYRFGLASEDNFDIVQSAGLTGGDARYDTLKATNTQYELLNKRFPQFISGFSRIAAHEKKPRLDYSDDLRLTTNASNLEPVLKRILTDTALSEEIHEWLTLFIPGFSKVEVVSGTFDSQDTLLVYENEVEKPFTKNLISDGTYNILTLLTAIYQSDEPQFLCIEEPENGLHPQVQMTLVDFFRTMCAEKGHYIWLNTHSEAVVRKLTTDELILVNKVNGTTQTKQIKGKDIYDIPTDEAWLTGTLGGGLPW